jgi:hypothetical protein
MGLDARRPRQPDDAEKGLDSAAVSKDDRVRRRPRDQVGTFGRARWPALVACVLLLALGSAGAGNVDLSPASFPSTGALADCGPARTVSASADAWVDEGSPSNNLGSDSILKVQSKGPSVNFRALVRFSLPPAPEGCVLESGTLRLYAASAATGRTLHALRLAGTWIEGGVTWANQPGTTGAAAATASGSGYREWSVTAHVQAMYAGGNNGFLIRDAVESGGGAEQQFHSREKGESPPQLVLLFGPDGSEPPPPPEERTVVYALGDGADGSATSRALADYVAAQNPDRFFYLGDVYETGTAAEFASNYEPLYGSMAPRTDPVLGNHESGNRSSGYYPYWMSKRGWTQEQAKHRSYVDSASGWQIIAYSSEEANMATEAAWVAGEVAKHAGTCRIVMAHKGRHVVVDTAHNDNVEQEPVWAQIVGKTAINLVGHNHIYGRLAPIDGVTVIVSGAGGHNLRSLGSQHHTVVASRTGVATATRLVLRSGAADFVQVDANGTVYDSGTVTCTPPPPPPPPDTIPPETTITAGPANPTTSSTATFDFEGNDDETPAQLLEFQCRLDSQDDAAWADCLSPKEYTGLSAGSHTFEVRALDAAGNVDPTPASYTWTIALPSDCGGARTVSASADAWIDQNSSSTNKGTDSILKVQSKGPSDNFRALVRFSLPPVPAGCVLESATLRLYAASAATGRTLQALRLAGSWTEGGVTWANQPGTTGGAAATASGAAYREWNVTAQVQAMYTGANSGFLIRDAVESGGGAEQQFHSREKGETPPALVLTFG